MTNMEERLKSVEAFARREVESAAELVKSLVERLNQMDQHINVLLQAAHIHQEPETAATPTEGATQ